MSYDETKNGIQVVMGSEKEATVTVITGEALTPEREYKYKGMSHSVASTNSFIDFMLKYGNKETSIVDISRTQMSAILDESIRDRNQDTLSYPIVASEYFRSFCKQTSEPFTQHSLSCFLDKFANYIDGAVDLKSTIQIVKISAGIKMENVDTDDKYKVSVEVDNKVTSGTIPKTMTVTMPIYKGGETIRFTTNFEMIIPEKADEKIKFQISFPFLEEILQQAFDLEFEKVKKGLPGYLILETN